MSTDLLALRRDLTTDEIAALYQATRPTFRARTVEDFADLLNSCEPRVRWLERRLLLERIDVSP